MIEVFEGPTFFLSNFYEFDGTTVEHHFQAAKTDDPVWARKILDAPAPRDAKRLGRQAPIRPTWDDERIPVMRALLRWKFSSATTPILGKMLNDTGDQWLIEGNTWCDNFWGDCRCGGANCRSERCRAECATEGLNWLGLLLVDTRRVLLCA